MSPPEARHSTTWLLSLQGDLAMQIGTSLDAEVMLRHFLMVLTRRLSLRAAQIWWRPEATSAAECFAFPSRCVSTWAQDAARQHACAAFFEGEAAAPAGLHAFRASKSLVLFIEEGHIQYSAGARAVLAELMPRLAFACQACRDHRRSADLLELTRSQNRELQDARARAETAWRSRNEFLAAISHEMRTPLNSVLGFSELLSLELEGDERAEYAATIYSSGRHLLAMFNDLLDLARLDARRLVLNPEDVDLVHLCRDIWRACAEECRRRGISAELVLAEDLPARVRVDPVRLRQILNNLLGNALKFTREGRVGLAVQPEDGGIVFRVSDTGPGIRAEMREKVFERFVQAGQDGGRNAEGTGLGLAIARELADAMGGGLSLTTSGQGGSVFSLHLPAAGPAPAS